MNARRTDLGLEQEASVATGPVEKLEGARTQTIWLARPWLGPLLLFVVLCSATLVVWREQVVHQQQLLARHTEDICTQAARRLEIFLTSRLLVANLFARRWSEHGQRDFSEERFKDFATLLIGELHGYQSLAIERPDRQGYWVVPAQADSMVSFLEEDGVRLLAEADRSSPDERDLVLAPPREVAPGETSFFAALPLLRDREPLGHLIVEIRARTLIDDCFHERIRSEFGFLVKADDQPLYEYAPDGADQLRLDAARGTSRSFPVGNQRWEMIVVPRPATLQAASWSASLPIAGLGLGLSVGLSVLAWLLLLRMGALNEARDEALREIQERQRAEDALRSSESRYHRVFDSATDGLIVLGTDGSIVEVNAAASEMLGVEATHLQGTPFVEWVAVDQRGRVQQFIERLGRRRGARLETTALRTDGGRVELELRGAGFTHGGQEARLVVASDITERNQAMRQQALLSRKVLLAQEEERSRLSRDLHDGLGQLLTATHLELDLARRQAPAEPTDGQDGAALARASSALEEAGRELRQMCRGLRPPTLDDLGLVPALTQLIDDFESRTSIPVDFEVDGLEDGARVLPEVSICAYRVLQEALTNVSRHASARSVAVTLGRDGHGLSLTVYDDGCGFDPQSLPDAQGLGLAGMRERAGLVAGTLEIRSDPEQGTQVHLFVPGNPPPSPEEEP